MKIIRNISFNEGSDRVVIFNLLVSEDGSSVDTPDIITLQTNEYQVACSQKNTFVVYKNG